VIIGGKEIQSINIMTAEGNIVIASITDEDAICCDKVIIELNTGKSAKIIPINQEFKGI
jgi:hypothetical protein